MKRLRSQPPKVVAHHEVTAISDYQTGKKRMMNGDEEDLACQVRGNVVVLEFGEERRRITVRPSGTEPKIKFYVQWHEEVDSSDPSDVHDQSIRLGAVLQSLSCELEGQLLAG